MTSRPAYCVATSSGRSAITSGRRAAVLQASAPAERGIAISSRPWNCSPRSLLRFAVVAAFMIGPLRAASPPLSAQTCMEDKVSASLRPLNCTANDVQLTSFLVLDGPGSCVAGEPIEVTLEAAFVTGAAERYDIGLFVALDGGNALTGQCLQDYLPPPLQPAPPGCTGTPNPDGGPYFNAECTEDPADTCGDLSQGILTYRSISTLTLACQDSNGDGLVDVGTCVSWDNQRSAGTPSKPSCLGPDQTLPNTKSKCRCEAVQIGEIEFRGGIRVIKVTEPPGDPSEFDFTLAGGPDSINVPFVQSAASPPWLSPPLKPGAYNIKETVIGTGWEFKHLDCRNANDVVKTVSVDYDTGDVTGIEIAQGELVTCTFSNVPRPARARVQKVTVPAGFEAGWEFKLFKDGTVDQLETAVSTGSEYVDFLTTLYDGSYTIIETERDSWSSDGGSTECSFTVTLPADRGRTFSCTYTNTASVVRARVQKVTVPGGLEAGWEFRLYKDSAAEPVETATSTGAGYVDFATNLQAGSYAIVETGQYGWDSDGGNAECLFTVTLPADLGTVFSCTYTNTKRGTVVIQKSTIPASDPTPFTFVPSYRDGAPFTLTGGNTDSVEVKPGTYTVQEQALYGWDLTELVCIDPDSGTTTSLEARQANLDVDAGETVVCTYTNSLATPTAGTAQESSGSQ